MRVADYLADAVYQQGVKHVFLVTGGGMMFLSDGVARHGSLQAICNHHEQASAMAAVAYSKYTGNLGVAYLTTGCGSTNAMTGLLGAWQDSTPVLFISGQSKRKETIRNAGIRLRQFGVQEADIVTIVESLTKYAVMVNNPNEIPYHLEKALYLARSGRPGPVWLDVPLDVQAAEIHPATLRKFSETEIPVSFWKDSEPTAVDQVRELLRKAQRPIVIAGQGIRLGKAISPFRSFVEIFQLPFVVSRLGIDCLPSAHPLYIGRIGNKGDRPGNFALQNADLVLVLGSRLSVSSTGHEYQYFAREAEVVVVDIDAVEHQKKTVRIDRFIEADIRIFMDTLLQNSTPVERNQWIQTCQEWRKKWPVCLPEYSRPGLVNVYYFVNVLSKEMGPDATVISDAGSAFYVCSQAIQLRERQRYITSGAQADMGYTLPASIGACFARDQREVIGVTGDGSFQMNIQELQSIVHHQLPIKIFVWNNDGYLSIRATQSKFFQGRSIGTDRDSGVSFPNLERIANAYGIHYVRISSNREVTDGIQKVLSHPSAVLCEVMCIRDQEIIPTVASMKREDGTLVSKPLEDMYPYLNREEFRRNMIVKPLPSE